MNRWNGRSRDASGRRAGMMIVSLLVVVAACHSNRSETTSDDVEPRSGSSPSSGAGELLGNISIDGSSTVLPFTEAAADEFKKEYPNIHVTVAVSGTGGGFKRFVVGETDISNASRPITAAEFAQCKANKIAFLELPVAYDGLTIVTHPSNDWVDQLTIGQLRQIFVEGGATQWSQVKEGWPDRPIKIFSPGTDSGTFDYFKEVVVGKTGAALRSDVSVSEDDNVLVTGVAGEREAIGFFGASYYFANRERVKAVPIVNPDTGAAVAPTAEAIKSGDYAPFGRPLFIYVHSRAIRRPEVKKFVDFQIKNAARLAGHVGYVALPDSVYTSALDHVANRLTGTHYLAADGTKRAGPVEQVFQEANLVDSSP